MDVFLYNLRVEKLFNYDLKFREKNKRLMNLNVRNKPFPG